MARDLTTRDPAEIRKDLATEGLAPNKKGQLRLELIKSLEDRKVQGDERIAELESRVQGLEDEGKVAPVEIGREDAAALGRTLLAAHLTKFGTSTRDLGSLINNADTYKEAFMGFLKGGDFETTYAKFRRVAGERDKALKEKAVLIGRNKHLGEQVEQYKRDLTSLGAPV